MERDMETGFIRRFVKNFASDEKVAVAVGATKIPLLNQGTGDFSGPGRGKSGLEVGYF